MADTLVYSTHSTLTIPMTYLGLFSGRRSVQVSTLSLGNHSSVERDTFAVAPGELTLYKSLPWPRHQTDLQWRYLVYLAEAFQGYTAVASQDPARPE